MAMLLALAGGAAIGAAFVLRQRNDRLHVEKRQHKTTLQAWEGEGGSLAAPAAAPRNA
jgi:shikimate 5-dehydrogenase